jgi:Restriction endonuclease/Holliday junction DNA helicase RuvB P-loop domain
LAAILTNVEKGQVLFIENIHRLRRWALKLILPAVEDYHIDYLIGKGPAARTIKVNLAPFTLIATVHKETECPRELLSRFPLVLRMQNYSEPENEMLCDSIGEGLGYSLPDIVRKSIARASEGRPSRFEQLLKELARIGKGKITEDGAIEALRVMGVSTLVDGEEQAPVLAKLSGTQFEQLITQLLSRMGLRAEMTKATGDGGIDIIAVLEKSIVGGRYLIQCKRFAGDSPVSAPTVREFYGALTADRKAVKGILITTSSFTAQASEFAKNSPLELIDGNKLLGLFQEYDMPVSV